MLYSKYRYFPAYTSNFHKRSSIVKILKEFLRLNMKIQFTKCVVNILSKPYNYWGVRNKERQVNRRSLKGPEKSFEYVVIRVMEVQVMESRLYIGTNVVWIRAKSFDIVDCFSNGETTIQHILKANITGYLRNSRLSQQQILSFCSSDYGTF